MIGVLLPHLAGVVVERVERERGGVCIRARSRTGAVCCPGCGGQSSRVHSRYTRALADLAAGGQRVVLRVRVRRLFCDAADCARKTFAEQISELTEPYARHTVRLRRLLETIGLALAGRAGARFATRLGVTTSKDSLLRLVRGLPEPACGPVACRDDGTSGLP